MTDPSALLDYYEDNIFLFLAKLRGLVFSSPPEAAKYFYFERTRINCFENDTIPHKGYIASLIKLVVEREGNADQTQQQFLTLFNTIQIGRATHRRLHSWHELCLVADEYLDKRRAKFEERLLTRNNAKDYAQEDWLDYVQERMGRPNHHGFIGMTAEFKELMACLKTPDAYQIIALTGLGGIGKTTLAQKLAESALAEGLFKDVGWISVRNCTGSLTQQDDMDPLDIDGLFEKLLLQLVPELPRSTDAAQSSAQDLLKIRFKRLPHLVVIDNLENETDLEILMPALLPLANYTQFLLTSRLEIDAPAIYQKPLIGLTASEALALMRNEASKRNIIRLVRANNGLLEKIYAAVGGNPLALRLVVGQAHLRPLDVILAKLDELAIQREGKLFNFIYRDVWKSLKRQAQYVWLSLLQCPPQGANLSYLAALNQLPLDTLATQLELLEALNLVNSNQAAIAAEMRYTIHHLTRTYLQYVYTQDRLYIAWSRQMMERSLRHLMEALTDLDVLSTEQQEQCIQILQSGLEDEKLWDVARSFLLQVLPKMERTGIPETWVPVLTKGIRISRSRREHATEGELRFQLGTLRQRQGKYLLAAQEFEASTTLFAHLGEKQHQARSLNRRAYVARLESSLELAEALAHQALALLLELSELSEHHVEQAYSQLVLGTVALDRQAFEEAVDRFQYAFELSSYSEPRLAAWCLTNLGAALPPMGHHAEAINVYQQALEILRDLDDPIHLAITQMNLGDVYLMQGSSQKALDFYAPAQNLFDQVGDWPHLAQVYTNQGMALTRLCHWNEAEALFQKAIRLYQELSMIGPLVHTMDGLGWCYLDQNRAGDALSIFREAFALLTGIQGSSSYSDMFDTVSASLAEAQRRIEYTII